jgi:diguanylate cyclase (GGDEF)-like protein
MQRVRLKQRILIPFVIASLFLFVLSMWSIQHEENEHMDADFLSSAYGIRASYQDQLQDKAKKLKAALEFIVEDQDYKDAFRARDSSALLGASRQLFDRLQANYNITHFYFHDPERTNILRVHQPDRRGDRIDRLTALEAEQSGRFAWGVELGPLGTFTLRAVMPWRDNGTLLGYVELGEEVEQGSVALASAFGVDIFILVDKQHLDKKGWEAGMRMLGRPPHWDLLPYSVLAFQTSKHVTDSLLQSIVSDGRSAPGEVVRASVDGHEYRGTFIPLLDAGQRKVGDLLAMEDMTSRLNSTYQTMVTIFGTALVVGAILFGLFFAILGRVERQLTSHQKAIEKETQVRLDIQQEHMAELERQARNDTLTGLPNRRSLLEQLNQIVMAPDAAEHPHVLLQLTVGRMREINNTLGHEIGDRLLHKVGERLQAGMSDAVMVACLGGNEFAVLLQEPPDDLKWLPVETVKDLFRTPFSINGTTVSSTATVGVVFFPEHGADASLLVRRADVAMRQAKQLQKGCEVYNSSRDPYSLRRLTLATDLRRAIDNGEMSLHFQPQVGAANGFLEGVEALARWHHPEHGSISPGEFIPLAESIGLIGSLTYWVLDESLRQCAAWVKVGLDIKVSVNVSAPNLVDSAFPDKVAALLLQRQLDPERLMLEVTESVFMQEPEHSLATLDRLKSMGVSLSIDDFGTGYSSLAYLKRLPVHELKIDQSFIFDMLTDENDAMIVSSTVALAHGLGLKVVAEGVETKEVWDSLKALGCDTIQGYYVGRPMPAEEMLGWQENSVRLASNA